MAQPTTYNRQFNFQDFQATQPTTPLPGDEADKEFNAVKLTLDQTLVNLAKIQRDDGALKNGIVTQESLSPSLSIGFTFRGSWQTATNYLVSDGVAVGSIFYKAKSSHLSEVTNQPPNAAFWDPVADITPLAIGADSVSTAALQDSAVTTPKLGPLAVTDAKLAANAVTTAKILDANVTTAKIADANVTTAKILDANVTTAKILDANVTNAKLAGMAAATLKGSIAGGAPADLTAAQVRSIIVPGYDVIIEDQKASGTGGGNFASGADQIRTLNTLVLNRGTIAALASNQFTLPAGTYQIEWRAPGYNVTTHQSLLYNVTDAAAVARGSSSYTLNAAGVQTDSHGVVQVTIAGSKAFEIRHRCSVTNAAGLGQANSFGTEVYTQVRIKVVA